MANAKSARVKKRTTKRPAADERGNKALVKRSAGVDSVTTRKSGQEKAASVKKPAPTLKEILHPAVKNKPQLLWEYIKSIGSEQRKKGKDRDEKAKTNNPGASYPDRSGKTQRRNVKLK